MVFFLDMILLVVSTLVFSSWVNVCVCVFAVYGPLSSSVWLGVSGFPLFSVLVTVLGSLLIYLLVDLSLEFEWQQVSSSLQDSFQYSNWSQQCCSLNGLYTSSYFHILLSLYQSFSDYTKSTNYNWYHHHFHVPRFFQFPSKVQELFSHSFNFTLGSAGTAKSTILQVLFFSCWLLLRLVVWPRFGDPFVSQNLRGVCVSHSSGQILGCVYTVCSYGQTSIFA